MIPEGWSVCPLEELALVERGKFSMRPRNDPKYYGGNIPFVQTGDVTAAKTYLKSFTQTLNEDGLKVSRLFPKNSILMTIAANIGDTAIATFDVACPDSVVAIQSYKEKSDYFWLKLILETCKSDLDAKATQNAQKNINLQILRPLLIRTPPLCEQTKIANILSTWIKAINVTEKLIENSQAQKKALMQQLLTGEKRLKGFKNEWHEKYLFEIAKITMGSSPKSEAYNTNNIGLPLLQGNADIKNRLSQPRIYTSQITKECFLGDILMSVRAPVGEIAKSVHHACIGRGISSIKANENIFQEYLHQWLLWFEPKWQSLSQGSTFDSVNSNDIKKLKLLIPDNIKEQQKIASVLSAADKEIELLQQKLAFLNQEKKALMQQLLTGKCRVKVDKEIN